MQVTIVVFYNDFFRTFMYAHSIQHAFIYRYTRPNQLLVYAKHLFRTPSPYNRVIRNKTPIKNGGKGVGNHKIYKHNVEGI